MDFRNNMNTPREMVDNDMLLRILAENEQTSACYGGNGRNSQNGQRRRESSCGCGGSRGSNQGRSSRDSRQTEAPRSCGCKNHSPQAEPYEARDQRSGGIDRGRCGCAGNQASEQNVSSGAEGCSSCGNREKCGGMAGFPIAMAYVPWQIWRNLIECDEEALKTGTIFNELNLPWYQSACSTGGCSRCGEGR